MQMKTMTAHENKTKNNRPVGIMLSIQDAADTLVPEMFMEKEAGYDDWFAAKVNKTLANFENADATRSDHDTVMQRVWEKLQAKKSTLTS
jgi:hypothetical protein